MKVYRFPVTRSGTLAFVKRAVLDDAAIVEGDGKLFLFGFFATTEMCQRNDRRRRHHRNLSGPLLELGQKVSPRHASFAGGFDVFRLSKAPAHVSLRGAATHTVFVGRTRPSTWLEPFGGLINNIVLLMQLLPSRKLRGIALCAGTRAPK